MTPPVRLVALLALVCSCVVCFAQTQTKNTEQKDLATVSGKVTLKGKPAPGVVVLLRKDFGGNPYENVPRGTTDQTGAYRINDVPPGSYQLAVLAPAYVVADSSDMRGRTLVLGASENVENINFTIVRGGVITGKVTDSEGRPVMEQQVYAFRADAFNQLSPSGPTPTGASPPPPRRPSISPAFSATTDDRGVYRMFGVSAGQYKIAIGRSDDMFQGSMMIGRASYQQTFHPNVSDQTRATVVDVSEGSEATSVDINVGPQLQTYSAAGRAVDSEKFMPVPNTRFGLQRIRGEQPQFINTLLNTSNNGDFLAEGLLPGKYRVFLMPEPNSGMRVEATEFEIVDHDVTGITIKVSKGAGISGVVVIENADRRLQAKLADLQIAAYVQGPPGVSGIGQSATSTISPEGSFNISGLPAGSANLNIYNRFGPGDQRWSIVRIERDGVAQARGIEVKEGEQVAGVQVIVTYGTATLRGVVNFSNGEPFHPLGANLRLLKPAENNYMARPTQIDARGHFLIEGVAPGVYDLVIYYSPPGLKPRIHRQPVTLQDNTATDVTVTLDVSPEPKP